MWGSAGNLLPRKCEIARRLIGNEFQCEVCAMNNVRNDCSLNKRSLNAFQIETNLMAAAHLIIERCPNMFAAISELQVVYRLEAKD